ncbi:MAG TPA: c-type cytochrome [Pyrinomonadaceae bacterium]|nr:c-type cytochrome [Pyrinomonadaceae bacterium]
MKGLRRITTALIFVALGLSLFACDREARKFRVEPSASKRSPAQPMSDLQPGPKLPPNEGKDARSQYSKDEYEENAYALAEGKRLFNLYNCSGCHSQGGGGMGPPLMDDKWLYGGSPEQIYTTILAGRPNGMPSFRGKLPDFQVWQLAAYVRSLSGQVPKDAAPSRADHLQGKKPENRKEPEQMKQQ